MKNMSNLIIFQPIEEMPNALDFDAALVSRVDMKCSIENITLTAKYALNAEWMLV